MNLWTSSDKTYYTAPLSSNFLFLLIGLIWSATLCLTTCAPPSPQSTKMHILEKFISAMMRFWEWFILLYSSPSLKMHFNCHIHYSIPICTPTSPLFLPLPQTKKVWRKFGIAAGTEHGQLKKKKKKKLFWTILEGH